MEGFALAPPPTVFHLTVGRGFLLSHSEDLGLCWSVFMAVFLAVWCNLSEYTWLNVFVQVLKGAVFWRSNWPVWHSSSEHTCANAVHVPEPIQTPTSFASEKHIQAHSRSHTHKPDIFNMLAGMLNNHNLYPTPQMKRLSTNNFIYFK